MKIMNNDVVTILNFIVDNYPVSEFPKVLEIAAGNGKFASLLCDIGYDVVAMDPKLEVNNDCLYKCVKENFDENTDISSYDLGISIHPCSIHKDIIKNFSLNHKALFLIPCCTFSCVSRELVPFYKNNEKWLKYLSKLNPKMKKKNLFHQKLNSYNIAFYIK